MAIAIFIVPNSHQNEIPQLLNDRLLKKSSENETQNKFGRSTVASQDDQSHIGHCCLESTSVRRNKGSIDILLPVT